MKATVVRANVSMRQIIVKGVKGPSPLMTGMLSQSKSILVRADMSPKPKPNLPENVQQQKKESKWNSKIA
jgi:hypothetical protein